MQQVKDTRIVVTNVASPVIAQIMVQLCERVGIISVPMPVNDIDFLASVSVKEAQPVALAG